MWSFVKVCCGRSLEFVVVVRVVYPFFAYFAHLLFLHLSSLLFSSRRMTSAQRDLLASINRFQRKIKKGTIDVWWLYDDGGLSLLVPYLISQPKSYLEHAKLRVFTISTSSSNLDQEHRNMVALLSKFRISFSDITIIPDVGRKPMRET